MKKCVCNERFTEYGWICPKHGTFSKVYGNDFGSLTQANIEIRKLRKTILALCNQQAAVKAAQEGEKE